MRELNPNNNGHPEEVVDYLEKLGLPVELLDVHHVFDFGAKKYAKNDWLTNPGAFAGDKRFPSIMRHASKWYYSNNKNDSEHGHSHLLAIIANAVMQYTVYERYKLWQLYMNEDDEYV